MIACSDSRSSSSAVSIMCKNLEQEQYEQTMHKLWQQYTYITCKQTKMVYNNGCGMLLLCCSGHIQTVLAQFA